MAEDPKNPATANPSITIQPGDVVMLKGGGPAMTVDSLEADRAVCVWFLPHWAERSGDLMGWSGPFKETYSSAALALPTDEPPEHYPEGEDDEPWRE